MLRLLIIIVILVVQLSGCAPLSPGFEPPVVNISSFRALPGDGIIPTFEIGLHVINPNRNALKLQGLSYHVELEGYRILTGVANQLPVIDAYGEGEILLQASPDLFSTVSLFTNLLNQSREEFKFKLEALLDVGGFMPKIRVEKKGLISLTGTKAERF